MQKDNEYGVLKSERENEGEGAAGDRESRAAERGHARRVERDREQADRAWGEIPETLDIKEAVEREKVEVSLSVLFSLSSC